MPATPFSDPASLVHPKETRYFAVSLVASALVYAGLLAGYVLAPPARPTLVMYVVGFAVVMLVLNGLFIGHVRGNGVRVSALQFPELHAMVQRHAERLDMAEPDVFVLQSGGVLNAFATRFLGRNFVVLYSDVLELASAEGAHAVSFIVGHELGHLKRRHITKRVLLTPSRFVPFLAGAYSRACEYTCDRVGAHCQPDGAIPGMLVLAAGKTLYRRVDAGAFARQVETEAGFWTRVAELFSSHPTLAKRVTALRAGGATVPAYTPVQELQARPIGV